MDNPPRQNFVQRLFHAIAGQNGLALRPVFADSPAVDRHHGKTARGYARQRLAHCKMKLDRLDLQQRST
jgi:hypothetical protein